MAKGGDGDHQFLCGLLHTVGKPILSVDHHHGGDDSTQPPREELKDHGPTTPPGGKPASDGIYPAA